MKGIILETTFDKVTNCHRMVVRFAHKGQWMDVPFHHGTGIKTSEITPAKVLMSVVEDARYAGLSLEEFVDELGYSMDTFDERREAARVHTACKKSRDKLDAVFASIGGSARLTEADDELLSRYFRHCKWENHS